MFDITFELILDFIKTIGWLVPVLIVLGFMGDLVREAS